MPIYEYACGVCESKSDIIRGFSDPEGNYECQQCRVPLKRLYSNVGVTFNGSGFYRTDNRKV
jgi:putative FmdB family regulatory protein